jgi:hypothetical protein
MTTHEVLVAARNIQERRGYNWHNGIVEADDPCCSGCSIAQAVGGRYYTDVLDHPAAVELEKCLPAAQPGADDDISGRTYPFGLEEVLAAFDRAIAATAPPPPDPQLSELVEAGEAMA